MGPGVLSFAGAVAGAVVGPAHALERVNPRDPVA